MKHFLFILGFLPVFLYSQNYRNICTPGISIYRSENILKVLAFDTVSPAGNGDTVYTSYKTCRYHPGNKWCTDLSGGSLLGKKVFLGHDGLVISRNIAGDSVLFRTQAIPGESWRCCKLPGGAYIQATVTGMALDTMMMVYDSVKIITLQALDSSGAAITHIQNGHQFRISKHYGFSALQDLYNFPSDTVTYLLAGKSIPKLGLQELSWQQVCNLNPGDIFHFTKLYFFEYNGYYEERDILTVLTKVVDSSNNKVIYTTDHCQRTHSVWTKPFNTWDYSYKHDTLQFVYDFIVPDSLAFFYRRANDIGGGGGYELVTWKLGCQNRPEKIFFSYRYGLPDLEDDFIAGSLPWISHKRVFYKKGLDSCGSKLAENCDDLKPWVIVTPDTLFLEYQANSKDTVWVSTNVEWKVWPLVGVDFKWLFPSTTSSGVHNIVWTALSENPGINPRCQTLRYKTSSEPGNRSGNSLTYNYCVCQKGNLNGIRENPSFTILPNPTREKTTLEISDYPESSVLTLTIFSSEGKEVFKKQFMGKKLVFGPLSPGLYFIRVCNETGALLYNNRIIFIP